VRERQDFVDPSLGILADPDRRERHGVAEEDTHQVLGTCEIPDGLRQREARSFVSLRLSEKLRAEEEAVPVGKPQLTPRQVAPALPPPHGRDALELRARYAVLADRGGGGELVIEPQLVDLTPVVMGWEAAGREEDEVGHRGLVEPFRVLEILRDEG
jgi:hypothetical protein